MNPNEYSKKYANVVVKAWKDEAFKKRLLTDPKGVLTEEGLSFNDDIKITIVEGSMEQRFNAESKTLDMPFPAKPEDIALVEASMDEVNCWCCCALCCCC